MAIFARLVSGNPTMIDYAHSAAVSAGDVLLLNDYPIVAHRDAAAAELAAFAAEGGVYSLTVDSDQTADDFGELVRVDGTVSGTPYDLAIGAGAHFGYRVGLDDAGALFLHRPNGGRLADS